MPVQIVQHDGIQNIFPIGIPKKRSNRAVKAKIFVSVLFTLAACIASKANVFFFLVSCFYYCFSFLILIEIILRVCLLWEEKNHLESRYEGKFIQLLKATFKCNYCTLVLCSIVIVSSPYVIIIQDGIAKSIQLYGLTSWILAFVGIYILKDIIHLDDSPVNVAITMDKLGGMDYGSAIAYSFFFGYLNLILPYRGDERFGLKEHMAIFEDRHGVTFGARKLFILIPKSAYCPPSIVVSSAKIDTSGILDQIVINRAGVKGRQYHNTVYKIWTDELRNKPIYVCAEYASILLTLFKVTSRNNNDSRRYKRHLHEIVSHFYLTLDKTIKNSRAYGDICELIYYRDIDNNGRALPVSELDIGNLLLDRIQRTNNAAA